MTFKEKIILEIILPLAENLQGTCATKWLKHIRQMSSWTTEAVTEWQKQELQKFIKHAYEHTVYYKRIFDELGLLPEDIQNPDDLKKLPIITKEIINRHYNELIPDNISSIRHRKGRSGGTTGIPMEYLCDENTWGYVTAAKIYYWKKAGYRYGDAFIALGSASLFSQKPSWKRHIYDKIRNEHPLNCVDMTDSKCQEYAEYIRKHNIHYIYGYAAAIYVFTKYVAEHNIDLTQVRTVFTTSENLPDHYRELIEQTFKCIVVDCYGAKDAGITGYETSYHHYCVGYNTIVEVINETAPNAGTALSTNFLNYSFPLIRYQFGDELELSDGDKEYNGQVITTVNGRTSDVLRLENGHSLSSTGFSMILKEFDIAAFQISKTGVNEVKLQLIPIIGKYSQEQEYRISTTLANYLGNECLIIIEHTEKFEQLANGKRKYLMLK